MVEEENDNDRKMQRQQRRRQRRKSDNSSSSVIDGTYVWKSNPAKKRENGFLLPNDLRMLIVGRSNSGKTVALFHLLLTPGLLDYDTLYVCGRSLHQKEYEIMRCAFQKGMSKRQIEVLFSRQDEIGDPVELIRCYAGPTLDDPIQVTFEEDVSKIPDPREFSPARKNLVIFDDVMLVPQGNLEKYFVRGRHNAINLIYISQNFFRLPRTTIRENSNFFMFFRQCGKSIQHIWMDLCSIDLPFDEFKGFCENVWKIPHNFVTIDLGKPAHAGKYRKNLNIFYIPHRHTLNSISST